MDTTKLLLGVLTFLACSAASADELGARLASGVAHVPVAMLYLEFPLAARHHEGPAFGLRMESSRPTLLAIPGAHRSPPPAALVDVRLNKTSGDAPTQAMNMIGPGAIVGIVVGAIVVVAAISDGSNGGSGGGY